MKALRITGKGCGNRWSVPVLLIGLLGVVVWVYAGDLDPPPGPIGPTMKTLNQVEARTPVQSLPGDGDALYVISEPGSYYLTERIVGEAGKHGIKIAVMHVTLDLNGFDLWGVGETLDGIHVGTDVCHYITIRNGTIGMWGGHGVNAEGSAAGRLDGIKTHHNGGSGARMQYGWIVTNCTAVSNGDYGFWNQATGFGCLYRGNCALGNPCSVTGGLYENYGF